MPIYAYRCESCGFSKDVLQKLSDSPLKDCPTCGKPEFKKQLTAAGINTSAAGTADFGSPCMACPAGMNGGPCG